MENNENEPLQGLHSISSAMKEPKVAFFEVNRTPPDERRRREKAAELAATQVPEVLMLTPFTSSPRIEFEKIKLGRSGVRRLVVRNPGDKPMDVVLDKLPKDEKGFSIDYVAFRLGGREETTLLIGWTPVKGGGVRDNFIVKFGKFSAQVILIGSCLAPEVKTMKPRPSMNHTRPLAPKNTNIKSRPSVPASKLAATPKIPIPANPVVRKSDSPPKRLIVGVSPLKPLNSSSIPQTKMEASFVCGREFNIQELPRPEYISPRRETFVHERPLPRGGDVVESTPIVSTRTETFRDIRRDTIVVEQNNRLEFGSSQVPSMPPPQLTDIRRQTFVPSSMISQATEGLSRRQTYIKLPTQEELNVKEDIVTKDTSSGSKQPPEILEQPALSSPPVTNIVEKSDSPLNLSMVPLNLSARPKVLNEMLAEFLDSSDQEPLNLSVPSKEQADGNHDFEQSNIHSPINLSVQAPQASTSPKTETKLNTPRRYCPQVSDISLPEESPCFQMTPTTNTTTKAQKPVKDLRLLQLMNSFNVSGTGSLDLSMGSQFGDCSLAVNLASPARDREKDLEEELENIEANREVWDEEELEMIARARGTSALGKSGSSPVPERPERLSSGTVVKDAPSLDPVVVPVIGFSSAQGYVEVNEKKEVVETNEVIEELIEYEYEIIGGERRLVGERNLGRTITSQTEAITRTPLKATQSRTAKQVIDSECEVSRLIEEQLSGMAIGETKPRVVDMTADQLVKLHDQIPQPTAAQNVESPPKQTVNLRHHQPQPLQSKSASLPPLFSNCATASKSPEQQSRLPGLRGSPRISNQISSHPESFLQVTINETSFHPPSPDDPRRCSTGVKHKENFAVVSPSPNSEVRKSLFSSDPPNFENTQIKPASKVSDQLEYIPVNNHGFELPVIESPKGDVQSRLSSDTYIASVETPALSTIQETDETDNSRQNGTYDKNLKGGASRPVSRAEGTVTSTTFEKSKDSSERDATFETDNISESEVAEVKKGKLTVLKERTPATPKRKNISYTPQDIATIALTRTCIENSAETEVGGKSETGLMFFPISPNQSEKRKPEVVARSEQVKKTKTMIQANRPTVRAVKNPVPPRIVAKRVQSAQTKNSKEETNSKKNVSIMKQVSLVKGRGVTKSLPPKPTASRVTQPARRLHLVKPGKPGMVHHPNPFAARNQYYDERWVDKQERGFTKWLNFMLTPQVLDDQEDVLPGNVDVAKLWSQCTKDVKVPRAPTREVMSMRAYTARREMNRLRRAACKLWQSREVAVVIGKVEFEIEKLRLVIRKDRNITKDVGMKQALLKIILSYNPLWLRIGLETVYGELLPVSTNSDLLGLSRFLVARLLSNPDILAEFAHPTVPHSYRDGHQEALNRFALKKFLELVYFLDIAKESRLIRHNPCLFCPDSQFKTSRDVLITFSKDYLSGEGDITKHMAYMGYMVTHKQTKLDEFDYAVTNIKTDLRCGLRLAKVAELVTGIVSNSNMRVPAVSRLQKVHNTDVALDALKDGGLDIPKSISSKDVVDGNREKTLTLLWTIIFGYQLTTILDVQKLREEINHLKRSLNVRIRMGDVSAKAGQAWLDGLKTRSPQQGILAGENLELVMEWAQLVMAHYNVEVENWTVSWCDGRGLCLLVHHYQPELLTKDMIKNQTSLTHQMDNQNLDDSMEFNYGSKTVDSACYGAYIENEKANFKLLFTKVSELGGVPILISPGDMSNTIPDEKVTATFIGYLAARLLDLSREIKAARIIQLAWRRFNAVRKEEELKVKHKAARLIQNIVRKFLKHRRREKYTAAALIIQKFFRGYLGRREASRKRVQEENRRLGSASVIIQTWWRGVLARDERRRRMKAVLLLQAGMKRMIARRREETKLKAVLVLQGAWRRLIAMRKIKDKLRAEEKASVIIQSAVRMWIAKRKFKVIRKQIVMIQSIVKMREKRVKYLEVRKAVIQIQRWWRAVKKANDVRKALSEQNRASFIIQRYMRMVVARIKFVKMKEAIVKIQAITKGWLVRTEMKRKDKAAMKIQNWWTNVVKGREERQNFEETKRKVVIVQSVLRRFVVRKRYVKIRMATICLQKWTRVWKIRKEFKQKIRATKTIQEHWRSCLEGRQIRQHFLRERINVIRLQSWWRMVLARKTFRRTVKNVVKLQSLVRRYQCRQRYLKLRSAALTVQTRWRERLLAKKMREIYLEKQAAAILIQARWAGYLIRKQASQKLEAGLKIQSWWRMIMFRNRYESKKESAISLQRWWRASSEGIKVRKQMRVERDAAIKVQALYRGWRVMSQYRKTRRAAIIIQTHVRASLQRKKYLLLKKTVLGLQRQSRANQQRDQAMVKFKKLRDGVVTFQAFWRGEKVRKELREKREAAIRIQAWMKMTIQKRKYLKLYQMTLVIQRRYRSNMLAKRDRCNFLAERQAACKIQAWWKMLQCKQNYSVVVNIVIMLQSHFRKYIQQKRFKLLKETTVFLQKLYKKKMEARKCRQQFLTMRRSALMIQTRWRARQARVKFSEEMKKVVMAQSVIRGFLARRRVNRLRKIRYETSQAIEIQKHVKGWLERRQFIKRKQAVVVLQSWWRRVQLRNKEREEFLMTLKATVTLQKYLRGYLARKQFSKQVRSLTKVQAVVRGWQDRRRFLQLKSASITIQRWIRAEWERRRVREQFVLRKMAAIKIQAMWRGLIQRQRFAKDLDKIIKMQALVKGKQAKAKFNKIKFAALCIQAKWRATLAGRSDRKTFLKKNSKVLQIQTWWRMVILRKRFLETRKTVICCQAAIRGKLLRSELARKQIAAVKIQRWLRGCWKIEDLKKKLQKKKQAAITIQAMTRGWLERKRLLKYRSAVCLLQRATRGWLFRKQLMSWRTEKRRERAVLVLQRLCRAWLFQTRLRKVIDQKKKQRASIVLQSNVRGWLSRKKYQEKLSGIITIQRWWRTLKLQRQYEIKKQSILTLQTWWRKVVTMRMFCKQKTAAVTLQSWIRTKLAVRKFQELRMVTIMIQRRWREKQTATIQRLRYLKMREAAITLQSMWRGRKCLTAYRELVWSTSTMQRCVRGWLARRYVRKKKAALITLQETVRRMAVARKCRREFLSTRNIVIGLQARSRGLLVRKQFLRLQVDKEYREQVRKDELVKQEKRKQEAAKTITQIIRTVVERRRFQRIRRAATTIQKCWRGHWHRKVVMEQWNSTSSRLSILRDINTRLQAVNAAAKPEDCLGARTASAIDYIFSIKDVAQLICAVKTLDFSTRLSLDCCMKMTEGQGRVTPVAQLVSLMTRCNRSVPHMEVVSTILDILLNVARVVLSREAVSEIPNLLTDMFQTMLVYRDSGPEIFSKCCALLQVLSLCSVVGSQLAEGENAKKLASFESVVSKKKKLKDENQRRRSLNVSSLPIPSRKPLRSANSINQLNRTGLNSTMNTVAQTRPRKPSLGVATGPPWCHQTLPRFHEEPLLAIQALNRTVGLHSDKK